MSKHSIAGYMRDYTGLRWDLLPGTRRVWVCEDGSELRKTPSGRVFIRYDASNKPIGYGTGRSGAGCFSYCEGCVDWNEWRNELHLTRFRARSEGEKMTLSKAGIASNMQHFTGLKWERLPGTNRVWVCEDGSELRKAADGFSFIRYDTKNHPIGMGIGDSTPGNFSYGEGNIDWNDWRKELHFTRTRTVTLKTTKAEMERSRL